MKAAVLYGTQDVRIEEIPDPGQPKAGELRVRVRSVGVCGSDVHYYKHGRIGDFVVTRPMILGHEVAGIIEAVGAGVQDMQMGDIVAMEPGVPCGTCQECKVGRYNLCKDVQFFATPPVHGALTEVVIHPASFSYKVPAGMTTDVACLAEPVSVAIQAVRKADIALGERALVIGAGPIGVLTALVAQFAGAFPILVDVNVRRLEAARKLGFVAVQPSLDETMYDLVFECSGAKGTVLQACRSCRPGGTVVLVGMHQEQYAELPTFEVITRELQLRGVFRYANTYPAALQFLQRNLAQLTPFLESYIGMETVAQHFSEAAGGQVDVLKTIVRL